MVSRFIDFSGIQGPCGGHFFNPATCEKLLSQGFTPSENELQPKPEIIDSYRQWLQQSLEEIVTYYSGTSVEQDTTVYTGMQFGRHS